MLQSRDASRSGRLTGEIDLSTADAIKSALTAAVTDAGDATLVVDLRELTATDDLFEFADDPASVA